MKVQKGVFISQGPFGVLSRGILMEISYLQRVFQVFKGAFLLNNIIPKAAAITTNSILIQWKGEVTGNILYLRSWKCNFDFNYSSEGSAHISTRR